LRRIPDIFLGALLAVAIFAAGVAIGARPDAGSSAQTQRPGEASNASKDHVEREYWWQRDLTADFTLGLVIVGLFQVGLFYVQLRIIRESLDDAKEAADAAKTAANAAKDGNALSREIFVAEQRPWLRWSLPAIVTLERNGPRLTINGLEGSLTNVGRLPATNIAYFGRLYFPPPGIGAVNLGQAYFVEHMREAETTSLSLASIMPGETIPMRFGPHGIEIDQLPASFSLWLAFHARYMFPMGGPPNPGASAEIGTVYMVQPIGTDFLAFAKGGVVDAKTRVALIEFSGARLLT
jgi:hypothetical protein